MRHTFQHAALALFSQSSLTGDSFKADADQRADQLPSVASSSSLGISKGEIKDKKQVTCQKKECKIDRK